MHTFFMEMPFCLETVCGLFLNYRVLVHWKWSLTACHLIMSWWPYWKQTDIDYIYNLHIAHLYVCKNAFLLFFKKYSKIHLNHLSTSPKRKRFKTSTSGKGLLQNVNPALHQSPQCDCFLRVNYDWRKVKKKTKTNYNQTR